LFSTQDRYELAYVSLSTALAGVDLNSIDLTLLWIDGSIETNAVAFFKNFSPAGIHIEKLGGMRNRGSAYVIQVGMNRLARCDEFDWIGMFESDCYFFPDWLERSFRAVDAATSDGFAVGAITPLSSRNWLISHNREYARTEVLPASCSLFRPEAWRLIPPASIGHLFPPALLWDSWVIPRVHPEHQLGWDWIFGVSIFQSGGYESIATPATRILNCQVPDPIKAIPPGFSYVDEFLPLGPDVQPIHRPRDPRQWNLTFDRLKARADIALLSTASDFGLSHLVIEFPNGWHSKESDATTWWRWASGPATIEVANTSQTALNVRFTGRIIRLDPNQQVETSCNGTSTTAENIDLILELAPGQNQIDFAPVREAACYGSDPRSLSFGIAPTSSPQ
jgi:hypothetical protein